MEPTILSNMGLTLEQLQGMGAKPVSSFSPDEMNKLGSKPLTSFFDEPKKSDTPADKMSSAAGLVGHTTNILSGIGNFASGVMPGIAKSVGSTVKQASDLGQNVASAVTRPLIGDAANVDTLPEVDQALQPHGAGEQTGNLIGQAGQFLGMGGFDLAKGALGAVKAIPATIDAIKAEGLGGLISKGFQGAKTAIQDAQATRDTKTAIDAVNPTLTKSKLEKAAGQVVTGGREVTPKTLFHEQGLTPDQRTINLGTRLKDLNLGDEPIQNLESLRTGLQDAEVKLQTKLGDPSVVNLNADKAGLTTKLDTALNEAPTEHRIKDTENMMGHVVDYAKKLVNDAKLNFQGLRDAKSSFYEGAKKEFPSAFTEAGVIDTKSPSGYAIQKVGEMMSEHLYATAPEGSEIQSLIGREADIFRATQSVQTKAAEQFKAAMEAGDKGKIAQLIQKYPKTAAFLGLAASATGADYALHKVGIK